MRLDVKLHSIICFCNKIDFNKFQIKKKLKIDREIMASNRSCLLFFSKLDAGFQKKN